MRKPDYDRRVVVTGLGVISPVGNDVATAWDEPRRGPLRPRRRSPSSTRRRTRPSSPARSTTSTASEWMDAKAARRSESSMHFGVAAAKQALADSGFELTDENRTEVGVIFGSGAGGQTLMIDNYSALHERGPRTVAPTFIANALVDSCSGMIAIETGAIGHNMCMVSACSTGTHNIGEAAEAIRRGDCIAVISGSTEAPLLEVGHAGFSNMRGMGMPRPGEDAADRLAAVRPDARRVRPRRGRRLAVPRGPRAREGARREDLRRGGRLRLGRRRLGHDPADRGGRSARRGRCRWRSSAAACRPTRST